ncbi:MAG TPA: efflux transporter outer membrane subunit [Burkholderiaceae bacterium]|nr:efflux transporter outer membrane subunit [Burkholderiaceae bacterium]
MRVVAVALLLVSGCAVGPDYRRPALDLPAAYHHAPSEESARSFADVNWWEVFGDPQMVALIDEALGDNLDLGIAASQIVQAEAQLAVARSPIFPQLAGQAQASRSNQNTTFSTTNSFLAALTLSWEIDLWGRYLRATEAARADLLATKEARSGVITSLVAGVAQQYLQLVALRQRLEIIRRTVVAQRDSLRLVKELAQQGVQSAAEVSQAQSQLLTTENQIPAIELQIAQTEDALAILLGKAPRSFDTGASLPPNAVPPLVPPGVPSELLERRPDIRQAEQQLVATNANIGVAKARFFPTISLTGALGRASDVLRGLVQSGGQNVRTAGVAVNLPIFSGGALVGNYDIARAQAEQAALAYRRSVLVALQEVSDALIAFDRDRAEAQGNRDRVAVNGEALRLAQLRFRSGVISYLEILDAQRQLLSSQLDLNASESNQRLAAVQLYKALGGGWNAPKRSAPIAPDVGQR